MAVHKDITGTDAIHPAAFIQGTDPGALGANKTWYDTTAGQPYVMKVRDATDTAWLTLGTSAGIAATYTLTTGQGVT